MQENYTVYTLHVQSVYRSTVLYTVVQYRIRTRKVCISPMENEVKLALYIALHEHLSEYGHIINVLFLIVVLFNEKFA